MATAYENLVKHLKIAILEELRSTMKLLDEHQLIDLDLLSA